MKVRVGLLFIMLLAANVNSGFAWKPVKKNISEDQKWRKDFLRQELEGLEKVSKIKGFLSGSGVDLRTIIKSAVMGDLGKLKKALQGTSASFNKLLRAERMKEHGNTYIYIDTKNQKNGWTPLMYAIRAQQPEIVHFLFESGVDPDIGPGDSLSSGVPGAKSLAAKSLARQYLPEIYREYFYEAYSDDMFIHEDGVDYGPINDSSLYSAVVEDDKAKIGYLVDVALVNIEDGYNGITPLARAALDGNKNIVIYLLRHGANPQVEVRVMDPRTASYKKINLSDAVEDNEIKNLLLYPGYASDERYLAGEIDFSD